MPQTQLSEILRVERARRDLGLVEASKEIGINKETLARLEKGLGNPYYPTIKRLADYYGFPVQDLLVASTIEEGDEEVEEGDSPKAEAPTSPQPVAEEPGEERRTLYQSVAGALEVFCDEWENRLDRGDRTLDTLKEFRAEAAGATKILRPVWDTEFEHGEATSMFDTTLWPSIDRFLGLGLRYGQLLNAQDAELAPESDVVVDMREFVERKAAG